eukprot:Opistho-2@34409
MHSRGHSESHSRGNSESHSRTPSESAHGHTPHTPHATPTHPGGTDAPDSPLMSPSVDPRVFRLDFREALEDTPRYRKTLAKAEADCYELEETTKHLIALTQQYFDAGARFNQCGVALASEFENIAKRDLFSENKALQESVAKFAQCLYDIVEVRGNLLDQTKTTLSEPLQDFLGREIGEARQSKRAYDKLTKELDGARRKYNAVPRSKQEEFRDAGNMLHATRACFRHTALDHAFNLNCIEARKAFEIPEHIMQFMFTQYNFFQQGLAVFEDIVPRMREVATRLKEQRDEYESEKTAMESRHALVREEFPNAAAPELGKMTELTKEGYLNKHSSEDRMFKKWNRRYFFVKNGFLYYEKRGQTDKPPTAAVDLRLCTVKPANDAERRFCFELVTPKKAFLLQAESDVAQKAWIAALTDAVATAHYSKLAPDEAKKSPASPMLPRRNQDPTSVENIIDAPTLSALHALPGNDRCADCGTDGTISSFISVAHNTPT